MNRVIFTQSGDWDTIIMNKRNGKERKPKSIKLFVFIAIIAVGVIPGMLIMGGAMRLYEDRSLQSEVSSVLAEAKLLVNQIESVGYLNDPTNDALTTNLSSVGNAYFGRIMVLDSSLRVIRDTYGVDEGRIVVWNNAVTALSGETVNTYDRGHSVIIVTVPIRSAYSEDQKEVDGVLIITKSTDSISRNIKFYREIFILVTLVLLFASVGLSFYLSSAVKKPVEKMKKSILDIKNGLGSGTLEVNDFSETSEISESFNGVLEQMRSIDDSRQEFVSNVSHELKTPLTSMKVLADSINSMEDAPIDMYKEFMADIGNEIDRETKIINDLLSLVKLDKSGNALNITQVNMNELMELLLKRLSPIAEKQKVDLVMESFRPVTAEVDEVKFSLAIMNLVENGIKYNVEGGYVHVSLNADHQYFFVRVEDSGMGIPEDSISHIFDRFYRVDKSHSREIGGTGLGLAITKNCVVMHHGEIKVRSTEGEGTTFDVRVPLRYIEEEK